MQSLTILHTNDTHGRIEGFARIATLAEQIRAENADMPVLYFDGGDIDVLEEYLPRHSPVHVEMGRLG